MKNLILTLIVIMSTVSLVQAEYVSQSVFTANAEHLKDPATGDEAYRVYFNDGTVVFADIFTTDGRGARCLYTKSKMVCVDLASGDVIINRSR